MNIFRQYTKKSLLANRSRTLITILGIVLSIALMTAVIQGANSGLEFMKRAIVASNGSYHGYYFELTDEELSQAAAQDFISTAAECHQVGWAHIGTTNENKPYLLIQSIDENFTELKSVELVSGRMPENSSEILIPAHLLYNGQVSCKIGDTLTLSVGQRTMDGQELFLTNSYYPEIPEEIINAQDRTYTIVGLYERFSYDIEPFSCPGYMALTFKDAQTTGRSGLFFTVNDPSRFYELMSSSPLDLPHQINSDLLMVSGSFEDNDSGKVLYVLAFILVLIIAFGSISMIYNAFSISVSERTKQFGILKSVGATRKQIRASVLYEAFLLCAAAIPLGLIVGCTGIGITLWCLRDAFDFIFGSSVDVQMYLCVSPWGLVIASAVGMLTTLISAWIPAQRAIRVSPIDSIRQSNDVRIRRRDVRVSWLTRKLFGFEGMIAAKNFGRNRKRYRSTIFAMITSIVLFISATSFCTYVTDWVVDGVYSASHSDVDITYSVGRSADKRDEEEMLRILTVEGVSDSAYRIENYAYLRSDDPSVFDDSYIRTLQRTYPDGIKTYGIGTRVCFVDDTSFRELCKKHNLDAAVFFDSENPVSIAFGDVTNYYYIEEEDRQKLESIRILDKRDLPISLYMEGEKTIEGYWYLGTIEDENGNYLAAYYPLEYEDDYFSGRWEPDEKDMKTIAKLLPRDEALTYTYFTAAAALDEREFYLPTMTDFVLLYPYSMAQYVAQEDAYFHRYLYEPTYYFIADDHRQAFEDMSTALIENGMWTSSLYNMAESDEQNRMIVTVLEVFSLGFIILISLISIANVVNTISTSIALRRREFGILKSVGLTSRGFDRIMIFECLNYGLRSLLWGLPISILISYYIYHQITDVYASTFYLPWYSITIAIGSVFVVVFSTMLYATHKIRKDNPIDALRNENL